MRLRLCAVVVKFSKMSGLARITDFGHIRALHSMREDKEEIPFIDFNLRPSIINNI